VHGKGVRSRQIETDLGAECAGELKLPEVLYRSAVEGIILAVRIAEWPERLRSQMLNQKGLTGAQLLL
jgi:hypothetical protein